MYKHLTKEQRYYIGLKLSNNVSVVKISHEIKVHPSTVYREINRNSVNGQYLYNAANGMAELRRFNTGKKTIFAKLKPKVLEYIISGLNKHWSPEQISGRMKKDIKKTVSHKTIYKYIWHDKDTGGKLYKLLPHQGKKYKCGSNKRSTIPNRVDISERPKIVEKKERIGDWEADTIVGRRGGDKTCLLTLVDRRSKYTFIRKIKDKSAARVQEAIERIYSETTVPFITITPDNGTEFSNHQEIAENIGCKFFFARPYKSCDRGLNEHTNGKIRYFVPKKTDFSTLSDDTISYIEKNLNDRPRKILGFLTPNEIITKYSKRVNRGYHKSRTSQ
jgi:hypothetical protein